MQDRLANFLQEPFSGTSLAVEAGYQEDLCRLLDQVCGSEEVLSMGLEDVKWALDFKEPSSVWCLALHLVIYI